MGIRYRESAHRGTSPQTYPCETHPETPCGTETRIEWHRDEASTAYAVEVIHARRWHPNWLEPPPPERADARVVRLPIHAAPPDASTLPGWLRLERTTPPTAVAERAPTYRTAATAASSSGAPLAEAPSAEAASAAGPSPEPLWHASPYHRPPRPPLEDFLAAARAALPMSPGAPAAARATEAEPERATEPRPRSERARRSETEPAAVLARLAAFTRGRPAPLGQIATLWTDETATPSGGATAAVERWLQFAFGTPERLHDELLLARLDADVDADGAHARIYRDLRDASVPDPDHPSGDGGERRWHELAVDRRVLLEQIAPARALTDGIPARALAAATDWLRRYHRQHETHVTALVGDVREQARQMERQRREVECLQRLNGVSTLGPPLGAQAANRWWALHAELTAYPSTADRDPASGRVVPGAPPAALAEARALSAELAEAFETQRVRLASAIARRLLGRRDIPAIERLAQAIQVSDVDAIHRVLDDDLAALLDRMLLGGPAGGAQAAERGRASEPRPDRPPGQHTPTILDELAARLPTVDATEVESAVAVFRGLLEVNIAAAGGARVSLTEPRPPALRS